MKDPTASTGAIVRPSSIQPGAMFIGTFFNVECRPYRGPPRYHKDGEIQQAFSIVWQFELRDHTSLEPVIGNDGTVYSMWRFTSDATSEGSNARDILHAMAGRAVSNAEVSQLLAQDPDHMPTKLYGRSVLLIMANYTDKNGKPQVGIGQILALSQNDRARLQAHLQREKAQPAPQPVAAPQIATMGPSAPPAQQFTQDGTEVAPQPQLATAGATADGSADLPW